MKLSCLAFLVLVLHVFPAFSQGVSIRGILVRESDNAPIGYANIGIPDTPVGTISNEDGTFEVFVPERFSQSQLLFAALGYERKTLAVSGLNQQKQNRITLAEQITILKNVTVRAAPSKISLVKELGNNSYNEGSIYADSATAGSAMALLIKNNGTDGLRIPYHLLIARLRIAHNTFEEFKVRVRFLAVDSLTGEPGKDLVNQNIIATSGMKRGWLKFDLKRHNIRITVPSFYLAFEWLLEDEDRTLLLEQYKEYRRQNPKNVTVDTVVVAGEKVTFNSWRGFRAGTSFGASSEREVLDKNTCYYRRHSHGRWKRSSFILSARVTIANYQ